MKRHPKAVIAGAAGAALLAACSLRFGARSEFWSRSVSFASSYAPPGFFSVVYTQMHYSDGIYQVVLQDLVTGSKSILSSRDQTALRGVGSDSAFVYERLIGNTREYVWTAASGATRPLAGSALGRFVPNVSPTGGEVGLIRVVSSRGVAPIGVFGLRDGRISTVDFLTPRPPAEIAEVLWDAAASPAEEVVAVATSGRKGHGLLLVDRRNGGVRLLRQSNRIIMRPRWESEGRLTWVEGGPGAWNVNEIEVSSGSSRTLYSGARFIESAELHPTRTKLLLTLGDGPDFEGYFKGLHVYELDVGPRRLRQIGP